MNMKVRYVALICTGIALFSVGGYLLLSNKSESKTGQLGQQLSSAKKPSKSILFFGNPLLDLMKNTGLEYILSHDLKGESEEFAFTLAGFSETKQELLRDLARDETVERVAGGASQNSARVTSYISNRLGEPIDVAYTGCVGKDELAECMRTCCEESKVTPLYQITEESETGLCGCCFYAEDAATLERLGYEGKGTGRTLVTCLEAAGKFSEDQFDEALLEKYEAFYTEGFFIPTSFNTLMKAAKHAQANNKPFVLNLSSAFLIPFIYEQFVQLIPYATLVFGNELEFPAFWSKVDEKGGLNLNTPTEGWTFETFSKALGELTTGEVPRGRSVVITRGTDPAVAYDNVTGEVAFYPIFPLIDPALFKDTNAAGDSFVGGFLSALAAGLPLPLAMERAAFAAGLIVQMRGCSFPKSETEFRTISDNLRLSDYIKNLLPQVTAQPAAAEQVNSAERVTGAERVAAAEQVTEVKTLNVVREDATDVKTTSFVREDEGSTDDE